MIAAMADRVFSLAIKVGAQVQVKNDDQNK